MLILFSLRCPCWFGRGLHIGGAIHDPQHHTILKIQLNAFARIEAIEHRPIMLLVGFLRIVKFIAPSALRFASGLRSTAKMAFSKEQISDLRLKMHFPSRLRLVRPRPRLRRCAGTPFTEHFVLSSRDSRRFVPPFGNSAGFQKADLLHQKTVAFLTT